MFPTSVLIASVVCLFSFNARRALGLSLTSPEAGFSWNAAEPLKVQWSSVSTDPESFSIQISNQDTNTFPTGFTEPLKKDVKTSDGSATVEASGIPGLKVGSGYRVNLVSSTTGNSGILTQSEMFNVTALSTDHTASSSNTTASWDKNSTHYHMTNSSGTSSGRDDNLRTSNSSSADSSHTADDASHNGGSFIQPSQMSAILSAAALISVAFV